MLTGLQFSFSHLLFFLHIRTISACFKSLRNSPLSMQQLKCLRKTQKPPEYSLFLLKAYLDLYVFVSINFLSFLHLKLQLLPKFEVRDIFQRFLSFLFWVQDKIENSETSEISTSCKTILTFKGYLRQKIMFSQIN